MTIEARIGYSRTTATDRALLAFNEFLAAWIGPAALDYVCGVETCATEKVRNAILAITLRNPAPSAAGYVVCRREIVTYVDRDHRNGLIYTPISAIFEELDLAQNAHEYATSKQAGHHVICELNEWKA